MSATPCPADEVVEYLNKNFDQSNETVIIGRCTCSNEVAAHTADLPTGMTMYCKQKATHLWKDIVVASELKAISGRKRKPAMRDLKDTLTSFTKLSCFNGQEETLSGDDIEAAVVSIPVHCSEAENASDSEAEQTFDDVTITLWKPRHLLGRVADTVRAASFQHLVEAVINNHYRLGLDVTTLVAAYIVGDWPTLKATLFAIAPQYCPQWLQETMTPGVVAILSTGFRAQASSLAMQSVISRLAAPPHQDRTSPAPQLLQSMQQLTVRQPPPSAGESVDRLAEAVEKRKTNDCS